MNTTEGLPITCTMAQLFTLEEPTSSLQQQGTILLPLLLFTAATILLFNSIIDSNNNSQQRSQQQYTAAIYITNRGDRCPIEAAGQNTSLGATTSSAV